MPRTIESILDNHRAATERREAGKPIWDRHLRIKHLLCTEATAEAAQKAGGEIAKVLKASQWLATDKAENGDMLGGSEVEQITEEFEDIQDINHLNLALDSLYDLANADRVWIA